MRPHLFPTRTTGTAKRLPSKWKYKQSAPIRMCADRAYSSLEAGRLSGRPNKIGGFVVQGILRFTHLLSCYRPITDLPYKGNRNFTQSAGCDDTNQLLVKFFIRLVLLYSKAKLQRKILFPSFNKIGFRVQKPIKSVFRKIRLNTGKLSGDGIKIYSKRFVSLGNYLPLFQEKQD